MQREGKHITFVPTISFTGKTLKFFVTISRKTIYDELSTKFHLPHNDHAFICHSPSGCMNQEAFLLYLENVLIPGVNVVRFEHGLQGKWACLKLDGFTGHSGEKIEEKMKEAKIRPLWLLPHSSHLTQALDKVTFSVWKARKASVGVIVKENHQADRIMKGLQALCEATNFVTNKKAWERAGWTYDSSVKPRKIILDERKIIGDDRAPEGEAKQEWQTVAKRNKIGKRKAVAQTKGSSPKKTKVTKNKNQL